MRKKSVARGVFIAAFIGALWMFGIAMSSQRMALGAHLTINDCITIETAVADVQDKAEYARIYEVYTGERMTKFLDEGSVYAPWWEIDKVVIIRAAEANGNNFAVVLLLHEGCITAHKFVPWPQFNEWRDNAFGFSRSMLASGTAA